MHTSSPTSEPWSYWCSLTALGYRHYSTFSHAREAFIKSCAAWVNLLSKGLQTFLDLKRFPVSPFLWRSDAQRVRKLLSARNHALAEAAVHRVERRHSLDRVSPHRPTARVAPDDCEHIHLEMMIDDWWLMIGGCAFMKRSDPCEHGESSGYLYLWRAGRVERLCVDPLYRWGSHLYESSISLSKWNEWCVIVVNMMNIVDIHSYCCNGECFLMYTKYPQFGVHKKQHDVRQCQ